MKKIIMLVATAIVALGASAQVQFGAKVGFDMTNFWGEDVRHGMQPNYQAGVMMEYRFNNSNFAIAPEVVFAAQGGKFSDERSINLPVIGTITGKLDQTYHTNYINVPVMAKFYVTPDFSVDFGPQLGINVYSKYTVEGTVAGQEVKETYDLDDNTNAVDFGLGLGATYNLTNNAFVQARYTMGLTKTFKEEFNENAKNGNIQIAFGMKF